MAAHMACRSQLLLPACSHPAVRRANAAPHSASTALLRATGCEPGFLARTIHVLLPQSQPLLARRLALCWRRIALLHGDVVHGPLTRPSAHQGAGLVIMCCFLMLASI